MILSRELSWLGFNMRVLEEAEASENPLLERLKFISIFSSNLDEFFMVRIAGLHHMLDAGQDNLDPSGERPSTLLPKLYDRIRVAQKEQYRVFTARILPELAGEGIFLRSIMELEPVQQIKLREYFEESVLPVLTPVAIDQFHPLPILSNGAIEIAISILPPERKAPVHAVVEVPEVLDRLVPIPDEDGGISFVLLEDVIMSHLSMLFNDCEVLDIMPFRITRDMDLTINEDGIEDLLSSLERTLLQRRLSRPMRLEMPAEHSPGLSEWLLKQLAITSQMCYYVDGALHLKQLSELVGKVNRPDLLEPPWPPVEPPEFNSMESVFTSISKRGPIMTMVPFQRFDPVLRMISEAANDPSVLAIKQTLYRVSGNSPVVEALRQAAENGKQVTVILELKARFDEGNNMVWAKKLEESGAHVIYGISGLKIHGKALLVVRREHGRLSRYVHLATGNYNDKTATLYTDTGYFSNDPDLCDDVAHLFNVMTGYATPLKWQRISVAPFDLRSRFLWLIDREAELAASGGEGHIIAKMNALVDPAVIRRLYKAAEAGVKIELIVRGICCLSLPEKPGNIKVVSIVDRYLEHSRVYYFGNAGKPEYYLSSADWMPRNLDRRIEILFPVVEERHRKILEKVLAFQLADREKGRELLSDGTYTKANSGLHIKTRSQALTYNMFAGMAVAKRQERTHGFLHIFKLKDL